MEEQSVCNIGLGDLNQEALDGFIKTVCDLDVPYLTRIGERELRADIAKGHAILAVVEGKVVGLIRAHRVFGSNYALSSLYIVNDIGGEQRGETAVKLLQEAMGKWEGMRLIMETTNTQLEQVWGSGLGTDQILDKLKDIGFNIEKPQNLKFILAITNLGMLVRGPMRYLRGYLTPEANNEMYLLLVHTPDP
ncbi:MAG: hypothetical protein ABIE03_02830 [Patescibacteria group bacterium]|nr:hypothetical protein [Patescibacteria group bacterium]